MSKFLPQRYQTVFQAVILYSVLSGLLFSCGEGIRLFPFPPAEFSPKTASEYESETKPDYQKNIHRFENKQGNAASKFQRGNPPQHWANDYNGLDDSPFFISGSERLVEFSTNRRFFKSRIFHSTPGSRAPPPAA